MLDTPTDVADPPQGRALPPGPVAVRFEHVRFAYPGGPDVLHDVDLEIAPQTRVAVVGETGSGKTTLAKLLTRLLDPTAGRVLLSGVPVDEVSFASLRGRVVMVPQDGFLFDATVADNVRHGDPALTDDGVAAVFARLGLADWVQGLPQGVASPVGERGGALSVGERQLVAVARAYAADPDLLVLDEATSAVDPATEVRLQAALDSPDQRPDEHRHRAPDVDRRGRRRGAGRRRRGRRAARHARRAGRPAGALRPAARVLARPRVTAPGAAAARRSAGACSWGSRPSGRSGGSGRRCCRRSGTRSGLSDGQLGLALGAVAVAALPAMPLAGRLLDRHGPRVLLPAAMAAFALVGVVLGAAAGSPAALVLALLLLGAATGVLDVGLNAATTAWERLEHGRLLTAAHGFFSLGVLAGAVGTGLARDLGAGPLAVLGASAAVTAAAAAAQPRYRRVDAAGAAAGPRRPAPALLALGAVVAASFLVEDAVQSWGALHLERSLAAPPWVSGLAPGLFAGTMAAGRLAAHALVRPGREGWVTGAGGALTAAGLLVLALAPGPLVGLAGAAVAGAGVSVLAPTLMSVVGARSDPGRQGADLALVTAFGYSGFVLGPVLVGVLSAATSLPEALALLALLPLGVAVAGPAAARERAGLCARPALRHSERVPIRLREEPTMAGVFDKVAKLASSPQAQRAIGKAKQAASDPKNRKKINDLVSKVQGKGRPR